MASVLWDISKQYIVPDVTPQNVIGPSGVILFAKGKPLKKEK